MKLQQTPIINFNENSKNNSESVRKQKNSQPAFKGGEAVVTAMNFLQTNQAVGATIVDAGCMGIPRSAIDFTRSPEAGVETMRREFTSTGNDALLGVYGMGVAALLAKGINNEYGLKANKLFLSDDAIDVYSQIWNDTKAAGKASDSHMDAFLNKVAATVKGFNPKNEKDAAELAWQGLDKKTQKEVVKTLKAELANNKELKITEKTLDYLKNIITESTGVEERFKIEHELSKTSSASSLKEFIEGIYKMSKTLANEKVGATFNASDLKGNKFINGLKKLNAKTAVIGVAASMVIGLSVQPINTYLTKRKTGKSGFVGGGEENKSSNFKMLKTVIALAGGAAALRSIGKIDKTLIKKIQFKSLIPTLDQFKLVYGATIVSRILFARNENELRETTFKDSLGFANWLILGGFVSKLTAAAFQRFSKLKDKQYIRYNEAENGKSWFKWLTESPLVTRHEVLVKALKEKGISTIENGKAMSMKRMLEVAAEKAPEARIKVRNLGFIQFAGYLYSGLVLGIGIPKLNIAMTKAISKKKEAEAAKAEAVAAKTEPITVKTEAAA